MNLERINLKIKQLDGRRKRAKAYQTHLTNTETRRNRIAQIINNCQPDDVEELLTLMKHEGRYIR